MKKTVIAILLYSFIASQCVTSTGALSNDKALVESDTTATQENLSPAPFYLIESGDLLEIIVLGEEELSRTLMVMHNGTISFPLIGQVKVSGLTIEEASLVLEEKLKKYFTHPLVSVVLKSPTLPYVSVFGEVLRQGAVEYQRGLLVTDYIALAGGPTPKANLGKVKVVRFKEGQVLTSTINVDRIINKGETQDNYELKSGDWIYVSRKLTINWSLVIQTLTLALAAVNLYITVQHFNE